MTDERKIVPESEQGRSIEPVDRRWSDLFRNGPRASDDFLTERQQPDAEEREPL